MKILIDMIHPAHVHFYRNFISEMENRGHEIAVTAREKDIATALLDAYQIRYKVISRMSNGLLNLGKELVSRDIQLLKIAKKFNPDVITGIGNPSITHVGTLLRKKSVLFTDTEHAKLINYAAFPFASMICTPSCYNREISNKQVRYNGYHELAYLHPNHFTPNPAVLTEFDLAEDDPFMIVRFVSWQASHDVGQHGIRDKVGLVKALESYGRVLITSEGALPPELRSYQIRVSPEKLHDLLYYATLYVGEGGTTASEAAVLGTHAIHISTTAKYCGIFCDLNRYGLLWTSESDEETIQKAIELLQDPDLKSVGQYKRGCLVDEKIDVTAFMVWFIENYPESVGLMQEKSNFQDTFQAKESL